VPKGPAIKKGDTARLKKGTTGTWKTGRATVTRWTRGKVHKVESNGTITLRFEGGESVIEVKTTIDNLFDIKSS